MLTYLGLTAIGCLSSDGNLLSWVWLIVFLNLCLCIWFGGYYRYRFEFCFFFVVWEFCSMASVFSLIFCQSGMWLSRGCPPKLEAGILITSMRSLGIWVLEWPLVKYRHLLHVETGVTSGGAGSFNQRCDLKI